MRTKATPPSETVFVGLGANLGDAAATLREALSALQALAEPGSFQASSLYRSAPVDAAGPDFLNAVARFDTALAPHALLDALQAIEHRFGRERPYRNAPRTLDLDLLLYGEECIATPTLTVPHPRLHERAFVVRPLAEIAPHLTIPGHGLVVDLLAPLASQSADRLSP